MQNHVQQAFAAQVIFRRILAVRSVQYQFQAAWGFQFAVSVARMLVIEGDKVYAYNMDTVCQHTSVHRDQASWGLRGTGSYTLHAFVVLCLHFRFCDITAYIECKGRLMVHFNQGFGMTTQHFKLSDVVYMLFVEYTLQGRHYAGHTWVQSTVVYC